MLYPRLTTGVPPGATGVLFKENDHPDRHASLGSVPAQIYPAGPATVHFSYPLSGFESLTTLVTVLTFLGLVLLVVVPPVIWRRAGTTLAASRPGRRVRAVLQHHDLLV